MSLKMIDLFSGIGGIRIAFEENGVECVASSEIDKYSCATYFLNFGEYPMGNVADLSKKDFPDFDILAGGFPCQPFSIGGLRKGFDDARGSLFFEIARLLDECKPKAFLLENVQGIVNHDQGNTLKTIERILTELGYDFSWNVMNAKDYGVPQNRSRWYCVGFRNDLGIISSNNLFEDSTLEKIFRFPKKRDLKITIEDLLESNANEKYQISAIATSNIQKYSEKYLLNHITKHQLLAYEVRASRCSFRNDGISPCLTAKMGTGGNNVPILVSENRKLTENECLRIMGFPKWYKIAPNNSHSYKQIGNSVAVPVVSDIVKEMIKVLI